MASFAETILAPSGITTHMTIRITVTDEVRMQSGNIEPIDVFAEVNSWSDAEYELGRLQRFVDHERSKIEGILDPGDEEEETTQKEFEKQERDAHTH